MAKIALVTDSTADLETGLYDELNVTMVPLNVHFGDETFKDGVDLMPTDFYEKLGRSSIMPRTSQPSPGDFSTVYQALVDQGYTDIISMHLSAALSGTYQSADIARQMVKNANIHLIDTKLASVGFGVIVRELGNRLKKGASVEQLLELAEKMQSETALFFAVDTLEYLEKNGRIGKAQGLLGSLLRIKPILTLDNGVVSPFEKLRGRRRVIPRLTELISEQIPSSKNVRIAVAHGNSLDEAENLAQSLGERYPDCDVTVDMVGPVIGSHTGPGVLAVVGTTVD